MIRTLILLSPVYVSVFWIIAFQSNKKNTSTPAQFLTVFLLINAICFFGQYVFFAPYPDLFPYWEPVLAYLGSMAFPVYYIYFRLLTVDDKFTLRKHAKYLIFPILIATVYTIGICLTPFEQYKAWLYNDTLFPDSSYVQFLGFMRKIVKLTFVVLLVLTFILNQVLLKKYAHKAEQFYSDYQDGKYNNAHLLNNYLLFLSLSSLIAHIIGRSILLPSDLIQDIIWLIFSVCLYGIGYMGFKQKAINPTFELAQEEPATASTELNLTQQLMLTNLLDLLEREKLHLNSSLNIMDLVQRLGTNRTYISTIINQQYNQNFCSFINRFRLVELERVLVNNPSASNELLAEKSGFGSTNSMKRAIASLTGLSVPEWKKNVQYIIST